MATGFIVVSDNHLIAEAFVEQVIVAGTEDEPTVELHMAHGVETFTGDNALALLNHFAPPVAAKLVAKKKEKAKAEADRAEAEKADAAKAQADAAAAAKSQAKADATKEEADAARHGRATRHAHG